MHKKKVKINKAGISSLEIFILILSIFAFAYIVYNTTKEIKVVSADDINVTFQGTLTDRVIHENIFNGICCEKDKNRVICQEYEYEICDENCEGSCIPTTCSQTSSCKLGCCYDSINGLCTRNSPKGKCESNGGKWNEDAACSSLDECVFGCCIIGGEARLATERECQVLSASGNLSNIDFRTDIASEIECIILGEIAEEGACIIEEIGESGLIEKSCEFISKQKCLQETGDVDSFYENTLCTHPDLNTTCQRTENKACFENEDGVYFVDSCGNKANIYDESKVNDLNYWKEKVQRIDSCNPESNNINSKTCGNCNRFAGSICNNEGKEPVCIDLDCKNAPEVVDALGNILSRKNRINGESWCVYDSTIGNGLDTVGSRHFKYYCQDGKVKVEPCQDYRQEICVQSNYDSGENGKDISSAACKVNRWRECLDYNNQAEESDEKVNYEKVVEQCEANSDCYVKEFDFGKNYHFYQCLPQYPAGFALGTEERKSGFGEEVCSMGSFECTKVEKTGGFSIGGGDECLSGCDCDSEKFTQQMNDWCRSLGDCGGYVNIVGKTYKGYTIDKAPEISLEQYIENIIPKQGQKAEPGNLSELIGMIGGYTPEEEGGMLGGLGQLLPLIGLQIGKGAIGGLIVGGVAAATGTGLTISGSVAGFLGDELVGEAVVTQGFGEAFGATFGAIGGAAAAASIVTFFLAKMFGLDDESAFLVSCMAGSAAAIATGIGWAIAGQLTWTVLGIGTGVGIVVGLILIMSTSPSEIKETKVEFSCLPYQAPTGGNDCSKCNVGNKICSEYRCKSLGQACELVNEGTEDAECVWINQNDVAPPKISAWEEVLSSGFKYESSNDGIKIKTEDGKCIEAYTPFIFGIQTEDEVSQCKFSKNNVDFESMGDYFGGSNLFKKEHAFPFVVPHPEAIANELNLTYQYVLDKIGDMRFYVMCQDANGNYNTKPYLIDICIKAGPDKTAPVIIRTNPENQGYVRFNATEQDVSFFVNEPSECRWDFANKNYDSMNKTMICEKGISVKTLFGWECKTNLPFEGVTPKYYVKCRDKPWLSGIDEEDRNTNQESFIYELKKSPSELSIVSIKPEGEIKGAREPIAITLKVETSGGVENGKATCDYRFGEGKWIQFFNTLDSSHEQSLSYMMSGEYNVEIKCEDRAGNTAQGTGEFKLKLDTSPPKVVRVYNLGKLKLITDENSECVYSNNLTFYNCDYIWENATMMTGTGKVHEADWNIGDMYYIKCMDENGKKPSGCTIVTKALE